MTITVSGTTITFNDATTQSTGFTNPIPIANGGTAATSAAAARTNLGAGTGNGNGNGNGNGFGNGNGNVTSVATGNGLSGGTITGSGTLVVACPSFNSVGSYVFAATGDPYPGMSGGSNYSAGNGSQQIQSGAIASDASSYDTNNLSGTWKWMGASGTGGGGWFAVACRVS